MEHTVSLKLDPELGKDLKLVVDSFFGGDYDKALREAVVILVKKEKLLCHNFAEKNQVAFLKVVEKHFYGNEEEAIIEAANLLVQKYEGVEK